MNPTLDQLLDRTFYSNELPDNISINSEDLKAILGPTQPDDWLQTLFG
jgi:hypothetical protein